MLTSDLLFCRYQLLRVPAQCHRVPFLRQLRLHRCRRRHCRLPPRRHPLPTLQGPAPREGRPLPGPPEPADPRGLPAHARRGRRRRLAGAALHLRGRRHQRPRPGAGRQQLHQRRLLQPRRRRVFRRHRRRRLGHGGREPVVPVGRARRRLPPADPPVAVSGARRPARRRGRPLQRLHPRPRPRDQDRRHPLRQLRQPPHRRRPPRLRRRRQRPGRAPCRRRPGPLRRRQLRLPPRSHRLPSIFIIIISPQFGGWCLQGRSRGRRRRRRSGWRTGTEQGSTTEQW